MNHLYAGSNYSISQHAFSQMKARSFSTDDITFIINNGTYERTEKDRNIYRIPESPFACLGGEKRHKLNGAVVVLSDDECVITVFWIDCRFTTTYIY